MDVDTVISKEGVYFPKRSGVNDLLHFVRDGLEPGPYGSGCQLIGHLEASPLAFISFISNDEARRNKGEDSDSLHEEHVFLLCDGDQLV